MFAVEVHNENRLIDYSLAVFPVGWNTLSPLIVPSETMNTAFNKDESKLGVLIFPVTIQMLTHGDGLFDKHVQILGNLRSKTLRLENAENLVSSDSANLSDALGVTKVDADLGRHQPLLGELADLIGHLLRRGFEPSRWCAFVG